MITKIDKIYELFDHDIFKCLFIFVNVSSLTHLLYLFCTVVIQEVCRLSSFPFLHLYLNKLKCSFAHFLK